ncbi:unnamed protein product [Rotaria magnacalcarata]|uniref:PCI domain-containing protein n=1 Tax=Rotaria magnacalcarata TaxID=392030 RepID=A0A816ND53_9BILA|nr:unnamed protein product [Rotaria magnacalcarata]CAF1375649.1 unnamed protein product [Rotaria magnacalcarata]CAF1986134.1 unnamed protein product [Rotaria magnacalcarata]CAF2032719.1 unnamed protein product [Rotaria magnacalcarata]CAF3783805.1 unnamed protein product [Rotaria magnacalcarata]
MILSKQFDSNINNQIMDAQNIVESTIAASGDSNNNNSQQRLNGNATTLSYEENYQVDISSTNFELETITSSYTGLMRIYRLLYVADHCPMLRNDTLLTSFKYIQETHFIAFYKQILDEIKKQNIPLPNDFDAAWYERTQRNYVHKLEKLDTDLRNFRTNSIKDSIRRGHDDLGDHYLDAGDFFNAVRCYVRSRDYCVTPRHMITMCMNVIKASFYMQNWSNVLSYVNKAEQAIESLESTAKSTAATTTTQSVLTLMTNPMEVSSTSTTNTIIASDAVLASRLKVYAGLAELATKRYKPAARHFLGVSFDHCSNQFQDLMSPQTLIQYVCLCSLATFERSEIHRLIIMSTNVKQYLELEPSIRDILHQFYETSYSSCLAIMSQLEPIFALDQYLSPHIRTLYYEIRHRIIITYFLPYKNASMTLMARQLNTTIDVLEDELVHLIRSGKIKARIDSKNKILYVADTDQRWHAYQHALTITKQSEKLTRALLLRSAVIKANLIVKDESVIFSVRSPNNNNNNVPRRQFVSNVAGSMMVDEDDLSDEEAM